MPFATLLFEPFLAQPAKKKKPGKKKKKKPAKPRANAATTVDTTVTHSQKQDPDFASDFGE